MNSRITGLRVASVVFGLMFLGQLTRLVTGLKIVVGTFVVPLWWSGAALIVLGGLSWWLWLMARSEPPPPPAEP